MRTRKVGSRSPIKDKPLRHAGQSLEEERRKLIDEDLEPVVMVAILYVAMAFLEWFRYFNDDKPHPLLFSAVAVATSLFAAWKLWRLRRRTRALRQGMEGEKAVGQYLERLRSIGYDVFHDVIAPTFNIDHVLIGPAGIFAVETKTWSKPEGADARIRFVGQQLHAGAHVPDRDPIVQAKAQAGWLQNLLAESTGRSFDVLPVVLFPGWFVEPPPASLRPIWVLEPKALRAFLEHEAQRLEASDAKLASFHLSRYTRTGERERLNG